MSFNLKTQALIFIGGALGVSLRLFITILDYPLKEALPETLRFLHAADILSCALIGILLSITTNNVIHNLNTKTFLQTGFLGGLSSFSVLAVFLAKEESFLLSSLTIMWELFFFITITAVFYATTQSLFKLIIKKEKTKNGGFNIK